MNITHYLIAELVYYELVYFKGHPGVVYVLIFLNVISQYIYISLQIIIFNSINKIIKQF